MATDKTTSGNDVGEKQNEEEGEINGTRFRDNWVRSFVWIIVDSSSN